MFFPWKRTHFTTSNRCYTLTSLIYFFWLFFRAGWDCTALIHSGRRSRDSNTRPLGQNPNFQPLHNRLPSYLQTNFTNYSRVYKIPSCPNFFFQFSFKKWFRMNACLQAFNEIGLRTATNILNSIFKKSRVFCRLPAIILKRSSNIILRRIITPHYAKFCHVYNKL